MRPNPSLKWLDLQALAGSLRPNDDVRVRYFTARVRAQPDPGAQSRQRLYLRAIETLGRVSVHFGRFRTHERMMAVARPAPGAARFALVHKTEEKGSDVSLATYLLVDGMDAKYDEAVVVSNDADLTEAITQARQRFGPIHVLNPHHPVYLKELRDAASTYNRLELRHLAASQLPSPLVLSSGRSITKPPTWA